MRRGRVARMTFIDKAENALTQDQLNMASASRITLRFGPNPTGRS